MDLSPSITLKAPGPNAPKIEKGWRMAVVTDSGRQVYEVTAVEPIGALDVRLTVKSI